MNWIIEHNLFLLLCIGFIFHILWYSEFKEKLNMNTFAMCLFSILGIVAGFFSLKLFAFLELGTVEGMRIYGAVFFLPGLFYLVAKLFKRNVAEVFDIVTIPMIFTLLCGRFNCLVSGCCLGLPISGAGGMRWPTSWLEIVFYTILIIKLGSKVGKRPCNGTIYPIYMMSYGLFRFVIEWLREPDILIGAFHIAHLWSIIAFVIGAYIYIRIIKKGRRKKY